MKNIKLNVDGMECTGCENRIKNAIESINGVKKVIAKYELGIVEIEMEDNVEEDTVKQKIDALGFEVK